MRRTAIAVALLLVAVLVCIWRLPASLVALAMSPDTSRFVQLHEASGTVWNGRVRLNLTGVPPTLSIAWACRPSWSPPGAHCLLRDSASGTLQVNAFAASVTGEQLVIAVPVDVAPVAGFAATSTRAAATIARITVSQSVLQLKADLRASEARYRIGQSDIALGEVSVDCSPDPDAVSSACTVANRGGSARLDGRIKVSMGKATGTLELTPANGAVQRVSF
jgi:hypothetical protein